MNRTTIIIILLIALSCSRQQHARNDLGMIGKTNKARSLFDDEIEMYITKRNAAGDSIGTEFVLDSLYSILTKEKYFIGFGQYHTSDNKLKFSILGIDYNDKTMPTYLLVNSHFIGEKVSVMGDSLIIHGRQIGSKNNIDLQIKFDLKFDGSSFPWNVD